MNSISQNKLEISEDEKLFRKSFVFVLDIIRFNELLKEKNKHLIAEKILLEATTFGEHILTLKNAKNKEEFKNFQNKAKISAQKTKYLLQLCKYSENYPNPDELLSDIEVLLSSF